MFLTENGHKRRFQGDNFVITTCFAARVTAGCKITRPLGSSSRKRWQDVYHYKLRKCISVHLLRDGM